MANGTEPFHHVAAGSRDFFVYVLRDPRDGVVFHVGRISGASAETATNTGTARSQEASAWMRERAIRDDGYEVERVIVAAGLVDESQASIVENAVVAAFDAAALAPTGAGWGRSRPGRGSSTSSPSGQDPFDDPDVRQFFTQAAAEIDRLSTLLGRAEEERAAAASDVFLDAGHRRRLEDLILQQESEMARMNATLDRVRALRDLGEWAGRSESGDSADGAIRLSDLKRALD
jgi:hypothetical protein